MVPNCWESLRIQNAFAKKLPQTNYCGPPRYSFSSKSRMNLDKNTNKNEKSIKESAKLNQMAEKGQVVDKVIPTTIATYLILTKTSKKAVVTRAVLTKSTKPTSRNEMSFDVDHTRYQLSSQHGKKALLVNMLNSRFE